MLAVGAIARVASGGRTQVPLAALVAVCALGAASPPAHAAAVPSVIQTVPESPGMRFVADGIQFEADSSGRAYPPAALVGSRAPDTRARHQGRTGRASALRPLVPRRADRRAQPRLQSDVGFVDLEGSRVDPGVVSSVTLVGQQRRPPIVCGRCAAVATGQQGRSRERGRRSTAVSYAAEQRDRRRLDRRAPRTAALPPRRRPPSVQLRLLLFSARFVVRDALLGFPIGSAVRLEYPSGQVQRHGLTQGADLTIRSLPRGDYRVSVDALGISSSRPWRSPATSGSSCG